MVKNIHHINFLVRELDKAVAAFAKLTDIQPIFEPLSSRGANSARFQLGDSWLVFVSPTDENGIIASILEEKGEGIFLISFGCDDLSKTLAGLTGNPRNGEMRKGLDNWYVQDISLDYEFGPILQLCETH
ncbi:VOC family protein [Alteromonas stellipolaris]|uniref:VOC family protein n=1 Tax=Alteromonas stellipolaris TaxID=233316 RepID=UPI0026E1FE11|nr:VOC family protein [Alteromonas stellipolaris]MDO6537480.1 VOC family protein [Alteromonas stellipolaris]MDP2534606.1 VOC family protein [Alteromonas stellipolaris]